MQIDTDINQLKHTLEHLKCLLKIIPSLSRSEFEQIIEMYHEINQSLKDLVYTPNPRNKNEREKFEYGWGAQSMQFIIDCLPEFHRILLKHYRRSDDLTLLDVGAGSAAGSNLLASLHNERVVYSKIRVDAIDYTPLRERWVKSQYPLVNYSVANLYDLPDKCWDFVICSHVIEHVSEPKVFVSELERVCKGFAFIYAPYQEIDRIPAHINTITEEIFSEFKLESVKIVKSMGWHADIPDDQCILVIIDCRDQNS